MQINSDSPSFSERNFSLLLLVIVAIGFFTRIWNLNLPSAYVFDEVYHAVTAKLMAAGDPAAFEWWHPPPEPNTAIDWLHPPIAKYFQATAIYFLGYTSFSWRIMSALFGVWLIWIAGSWTRKIFDAKAGLLAAILVVCEGLLLVQSRIAMNDIFVTVWVLLAAAKVWQIRTRDIQNAALSRSTTSLFVQAGLLLGLAWSTKWSGFFGSIAAASVLILPETGQLLQYRTKQAVLNWGTSVVKSAIFFFVLPVVVYLISFLPLFLSGHDWGHFVELHQQIWWYQTSLTATHAYQSTPSQWFFSLRPVWYWLGPDKELLRADIYASSNLVIIFAGILAVFWNASQIVAEIMGAGKAKTRFTPYQQKFLYLCAWYSWLWIPWVISPRILFYYHYSLALPFFIIILAGTLTQLSRRKVAELSLLLCVVLFFALWYPHWTGIYVPTFLKESVYFALPSWR